jgi:membrane fusion protein (multidrug efflux system)
MENIQIKKEKNGKVYIPLLLVIILVLGGGITWYIDYSKYINSDDAHLEANNGSVSSKMLGRINQVFAEEGDLVKQGQLLVILDSTDLVAQKNQAIANELQVEATVAQSEAKYQFDLKSCKVQEITLSRAQGDFDRAKNQFKSDVITQEQYDHIKKTLETAQAQLEADQSQARVSSMLIKSTQAAVESAKAQISVIQTMINNTKLYAPCNGVVGKRWLMPGDIAQPGQSIYTIINDQKVWVSVFLEETKLQNLRLGQLCIFTVDTYPGVIFSGKITEIGSNTASQFSLIPANNASENFTKVTQRIQLKISVDRVKEGGKLSDYRLLSGMSAVVKIIR